MGEYPDALVCFGAKLVQTETMRKLNESGTNFGPDKDVYITEAYPYAGSYDTDPFFALVRKGTEFYIKKAERIAEIMAKVEDTEALSVKLKIIAEANGLEIEGEPDWFVAVCDSE